MRCARCGCSLGSDQEICVQCGSPVPSPTGKPPSAPQPDDASSTERRQLTVLFCDLVGSSLLAQRLDPEDLRLVLRDYQRRCAAIVRRYRGHVAQYLGDGLLVYFGYPLAEEAAPKLAVEAGLSLLDLVANTAAQTELSQPVELHLRVGIHTGPVVIGDMGDSARPERLAVGATPNLAARVQAEAEINSVLLSESTHALVSGYFDTESLGQHRLRGFAEPIELFRVLGRTGATTALDAASHRGYSPLSGRDPELATLREHLRRSTEEKRAVLLVGEPGLGKSRLVRELLGGLGGSDRMVLQCYGSPYHQTQALYPFVSAFERWAELGPNDAASTRREKLHAALTVLECEGAYAQLAPLLVPSTPGDQTGAMPSPKQHQQLLSALLTVGEALLERSAAVLVVEDLQWTDASTQQFLKLWLEELPARRGLCVLTSRPGFEPTWSADACDLLRLEPLTEAAAATIAAHVVEKAGRSDDGPLSPALLRRVLERAEGVPLYVEEIVRAFLELNDRSSSPARIPSSLQDSLMARLDRLGTAKSAVQIAAVLGREVPQSLFDHLVPAAQRRDLERAVEAGLMDRRDAPDPVFVFRHALVLEAAYQSLVKAAREDHHRRIGELLVEQHPELAKQQPSLLAHHFAAGNEPKRAIDYLGLAAQQSLGKSAFIEAIQLLQRALELVPKMSSSAERDATEIELRSALGLSLISTRGYSSTEVEEVYARARELCESAGHVPLRVLYGVWAVHLVRSDVAGVHRLAKLFERVASNTQDPDALLVAHSCLGVRALFQAEFAEARRHLRAATEVLDRDDPKGQHDRVMREHGFEAMLQGPLWLAFVEALQGDPEAALQHVELAEALGERIEHPYVVCQTAVFGATLAGEIRRQDLARRLADRALALSQEHELLFWQALALCVHGWLLLREGQPEQAVAALRQGLGLLDLMGSRVNRAYFVAYLADAYLQTGEVELGLGCIDEALVTCRQSLGPYYEPELLRLKGELFASGGRRAEATELFRAALSTARLQGARLLELRAATSLGRMLLEHGRSTEASDLLRATCEKWPSESTAADLEAARAMLAAATREG